MSDRYTRLHIPSRIQAILTFEKNVKTELEKLEIINRWNGQEPGVWQYWV